MNTYPDDTFLARWLNDDLSPEEKAEFEKSQDFARLTQVMEVMKGFEKQPFDAQALLQKVKGDIQHEKQARVVSMRIQRQRMWLSIAAVVLVLVTSVWWFVGRDTEEVGRQALTMNTSEGQKVSQTFEEGTEIIANENTQLSADISATGARKVTLQSGEAYFNVRKKGPFTVSTQLGKVEVLGTVFDVAQRDNSLIVKCFEGVVRVAIGQQIIDTLQKGEGLEWKEGKTTVRDFFVSGKAPAWQDGTVIMENATLSEVLADLEERFGLSFEVRVDMDQEKYQINYPSDDVDAALDDALELFEVEYERRGRIVVIQ